MELMIQQYKTNIKTHTCNCGECTLLSSMIQEPLPCSHLHYMGVQFPDIEAPNLMVSNCIDYINKRLLFETEPSKFVLGYPIEVFDVIDEGIRHFHK